MQSFLERKLKVDKNPEINLRMALVEYLKSLHGDRDKELINIYGEKMHILFTSARTLDRYLYYNLDNIAPRNKDQVVSRFVE